MRIINCGKYFRLLILFVCFPLAGLLAASESYVQTLTGNMKKGDSLTVIDDKFFNLPLSEWNQLKHLSVDDIISFELRQDTTLNYYYKSFSCTLNISIKYFTSHDQQTPTEIDNIDLVVKYDSARGKSFPDIARYKFKNAFRVTVVINSINSPEWKDKLPAVFRLKNQILVERKYPFSSHVNGVAQNEHSRLYRQSGPFVMPEPVIFDPTLTFFPLQLPSNGQLTIGWLVSGLGTWEEYDLEWTYIDGLSARGFAIAHTYASAQGTLKIPDATVGQWMLHDNTRVTVTTTSYSINLPYTDGYLLVRVRGASYQPETNVRLTSDWQYQDQNQNTAGVIIPAFQDNLNWQYTGAFAEEGKKKEVISYFDGTQRNRQSVTLNNSDQYIIQGADKKIPAVVQETIYDVMGRPAMNILPAPLKSSGLNFYPSFNVNSVGNPLSFSDIYLDQQNSQSQSCAIGADYSNPTSGASQYYSPNNPFIGDDGSYFTKYVPDAQKYPYSLAEYTPDNTGRIRRQGGVGQYLQIGSGKETNYYYGKPAPRDLERMFGMEVGDASHYLKNMVVDPNGQASVSYIDANGKTIATALAGIPLGNLDPLPSSKTSTANTHFNNVLISPTDFSPNTTDLSMKASSTFLAEVPGTFTLHYSVSPLALVTQYGTGGASQLCNNCYYTLAIVVTNECGTVIANKTSTPFQGNDATCYTNPLVITNDLPINVMNIGEYTVSYSLQLSEDVIKYQTDYYVQHNTDLKKLQDFFLVELQNLDMSACYSTCAACKTLGSTVDNFRTNVVTLLGTDLFAGILANDPGGNITQWINQTWADLKTKCSALSCAPPSPCEQYLGQMKTDVMPGGQYAQYDAVALDNNSTPNVFQEMATNVMVYYTKDNTISSLTFVADDGTTQTVGSLNQADFVRAYLKHPEWADLFVIHHIEYCSYQWCKDQSNPTPSYNNEVSYTFDEGLKQNYTNGSDAVNAGYYNHSDPLALLNKDPFFMNGRGQPYYAKMQSDLQNLSQVLSIIPTDNSTTPATELPVKNIIQLLDWMLYCKLDDPNATKAQTIASWNSCTPADNCRSTTMEWQLYLNYYLQLKSKYYRITKIQFYQANPSSQPNPNCLDCFIGLDPLAAAGCTPPGPLSDYQIVRQDDAYTVYFYLVYQNGASPFIGDYSVSYAQVPNFDDGNSPVPQQISAHKGDMKVLITSVQKPTPPAQIEITSHYIVLSVNCPQTPLATCASNIPSPPQPSGNCPQMSDFSTSQVYMTYKGQAFIDFYIDYNGGVTHQPDPPMIFDNGSTLVIDDYTMIFGFPSFISFYDKKDYFIHNGGPVTRPVNVHFHRNRDDLVKDKYSTVTMNTNQDRVAFADDQGCYTPDEGSFGVVKYVVDGVDCDPLPPVIPVVTSSCSNNPLYGFYGNKTRVFKDYIDMQDYASCNASITNASSQAQLAAQSQAATLAAARDNLNALKASWLNRLQSVRDEEFKSLSSTTLSDAVLNNLVNNLYQIADLNLQIASQQQSALQPASSLPSPLPAGFTAPAYNSFNNAFTAIIGTSLMQQGFSPDLLDAPYPYNKTPYPASPNLTRLNTNICSNISALNAAWVNAGQTGTFQAFLQQQLGDDYMLTSDQLNDVQTRCASACPNPYLSNPLILPVAFVAPYPNSSNTPPVTSFATCSQLSSMLSDFQSAYPNVTPDTKLYRILYTNYMNHRLGYPMSYGDYADFTGKQCTANSTALLYDKPQSPSIPYDAFSCSAGLISGAYTKAGQDYEIYIDQIRIAFRNAYISKCLNNQASAKIEGDQSEYHYTLYYYDQSGNLVKTIPPEGVNLLTDAQIDLVEQFPVQDPASCPVITPGLISDQPTTLNNLSTDLQNNSAMAMEMWLYSTAGPSARQLRIITPDNKYMYQAAIANNKLWVELYTLLPDNTGSGGISITLSNQAVADLSGQLPLQAWSHLFIQSPGGLVGGTMQLYLDGVKLPMIPDASAPPYPSEWEIASGYTIPVADLSQIQDLRMYNRVASDAEVAAEYHNSCLGPVGALAGTPPAGSPLPGAPLLAWGRFNAPSFCNNNTGTSTPVTIANKGSLSVSSNPDPSGLDSKHVLSSITNSFTVEFWVNPQSADDIYPGEGTDNFAGVNGHAYAIFPFQGTGGTATSGMAGMGVSVGTNGVTVFELADNYMPAMLIWQAPVTGWTHVAIVYNNKTPSLYINGQFQATGNTSAKTSISPSYNFGGGGYGNMTGGLDEVRIWNSARSPDQIANYYNKSLAPADQQGLAGYWPMDGSAGGVISDVSCNNNSAVLHSPSDSWIATGAPLTETNYVEYAGRFIVPNHGLPTNYAYNSLNQVIQQNSPDGGTSTFLYDRLGRLSISQNAEQLQPAVVDANNPANRFSYTRYDKFGRITEVGEKFNVSALTELNARNDGALQSWLNSGTNRQVTVTTYDVAPLWVPAGLNQNNLRKRVTATALLSMGSDPTQNRQSASYYNYDIEGNVSEQVQENTALINNEKQFVTGSDGLKHIQYEYDLISGKVNKVLYQDGKWDQFYYQYFYDADNRLIQAYSSRSNSTDLSTWTKDASYRYYLHGPLARMELGKLQVQGVDYAYTLQGWLKGVNGQQLTGNAGPQTDMSGDGTAGTAFSQIGRDVMAFSLNYFNNDYLAIGGTGAPAFASTYSAIVPTTTGLSGKELFNGNISGATYAISQLDGGVIGQGQTSGFSGYTYRYDQLNRLTAMDRHPISSYSTPASWHENGIPPDYKEQVSYDGNGNILTYFRNGTTAAGRQLAMDDLTYNYNLNAAGNLVNNKLRHINDKVPAGNYPTVPGDPQDLDDQPADNYTYDAIGNLIKDNTQQLQKINWTVYGKIAGINKTDNSALSYSYDPGGNRVSKTATAVDGSATTTHYVRDAQGNVLAVYQYKANALGALTEGDWLEQHLYGSSRLGMVTPHVVIPSSKPLSSSYDESTDKVDNLGNRLYELSNHLGNVLVTVSDRHFPGDQTDGSGNQQPTVLDYVADVVSAQDYYPFGMQMPGRSYIAPGSLNYRYGFNGKENDNEVKGVGNEIDYGMRVYDPRVGRFLSLDPLQVEYPMLTPYQYAGNGPISGIDLDGKEFEWAMLEWAESKMFGTTHLKGIEDGVTERIVQSAKDAYNGIKNLITKKGGSSVYGDGFTTLTAGIPPGMKPIIDPRNDLVNQAIIRTIKDYGSLIKKAIKGDDKAIGALGFEAALLFLPGGEATKGLTFEMKELKAIGEAIPIAQKTILNSEGRTVIRNFVRNEDDLLKVAEDAAGGSLDNFTQDAGRNWYQGEINGEKIKIEWEPAGHETTNEGPHVRVQKWIEGAGKKGKGKWSNGEKYFIQGQENLKPLKKPNG